MRRNDILKYLNLDADISFDFVIKKMGKLLLYALISFFIFLSLLYLFHIGTMTKREQQTHLERQAKATALSALVQNYLDFMAQRISALKNEARIEALLSEAYFRDLPLNHNLFYLSAIKQSRITPQGPSILTKYDQELLCHALNVPLATGIFQDSNHDIYLWSKVMAQSHPCKGVVAFKISHDSLQNYLNLTARLMVLDQGNMNNTTGQSILALRSDYKLGYHAPQNNYFESYIEQYLPKIFFYFSICLILIFGFAAIRYQAFIQIKKIYRETQAALKKEMLTLQQDFQNESQARFHLEKKQAYFYQIATETQNYCCEEMGNIFALTNFIKEASMNQKIVSNTETLALHANLVQALHNFCLLKGKKLNFLDLAQEVKDLLEIFDYELSGQNINLQTKCASTKSTEVEAPAAFYRILLYNIFSRIIDRLPQGGKLHVNIDILNDCPAITIQDNGFKVSLDKAQSSKVLGPLGPLNLTWEQVEHLSQKLAIEVQHKVSASAANNTQICGPVNVQKQEIVGDNVIKLYK